MLFEGGAMDYTLKAHFCDRTCAGNKFRCSGMKVECLSSEGGYVPIDNGSQVKEKLEQIGCAQNPSDENTFYCRMSSGTLDDTTGCCTENSTLDLYCFDGNAYSCDGGKLKPKTGEGGAVMSQNRLSV